MPRPNIHIGTVVKCKYLNLILSYRQRLVKQNDPIYLFGLGIRCMINKCAYGET